MRTFLFTVFILIKVLSVSTADEIVRFTPLGENERFAYAVENAQSPMGFAMWKMTLYAVRNDNVADISELFVWEYVTWENIQFTGDFRVAFFFARQWTASSPPARHLYMANGNTGEIRKIMSTRDSSDFRVTKDGRFIGFIGDWDSPNYEAPTFPHLGYEKVNLFVYDVENKTMKNHVTWHINGFIDGGWSIFRRDNIFIIYADLEGGHIAAATELNPETMELTALWDMTNINDRISPLPRFAHSDRYCEWQDDIIWQRNDPNIRLQR